MLLSIELSCQPLALLEWQIIRILQTSWIKTVAVGVNTQKESDSSSKPLFG